MAARTVLVRGVLKIRDCDAECKILASREIDGEEIVYSDFMVVEAPPYFRDGIYDIAFDGYSGYTQKSDGLWLHQVIAGRGDDFDSDAHRMQSSAAQSAVPESH